MAIQKPGPVFALVGQPNSGKSTLFNALTGLNQKIANYPGVTVDKKLGLVKSSSEKKFYLLDLPGVYSLRARSEDEKVTSNVLFGKRDDIPSIAGIVCVIDPHHIFLSLKLILQIKMLNLPFCVVMNDFSRQSSKSKALMTLDVEKLSEVLGCPVFSSSFSRKSHFKSFLHKLNEWAFVVKHDSQPQQFELDNNRIREISTEAKKILSLVRNETELELFSQLPSTLSRIDKVLLHPVWGIGTLLFILFLMFQSVFNLATYPQQLIQYLIESLNKFTSVSLPPGPLNSLICDGIINGIGSILVFLPQILLLFLFIQILEESGYMARAAFIMDKFMRSIGLSGRAFIPLLSSFGCAVPAIMSTRVIENKRERILTIMVSPLLTCSARLPVFALIISAFVPQKWLFFGLVQLQGLVMFSLYALGILAALMIAFVAKHFFIKFESQSFYIILPGFKIPNLKLMLSLVMDKAFAFIKNIGTLILALMIIVWYLCSYPKVQPDNTHGALYYSYAGVIGRSLESFFLPIGFNWAIVISLIPGLIAREVVVGVLGTIYGLAQAQGNTSLADILPTQWSLPTAFSLLVWYVFAPQCMSTLFVTKRETSSLLWPVVMFLYMFGLAYLASYFVFHASQAFLH